MKYRAIVSSFVILMALLVLPAACVNLAADAANQEGADLTITVIRHCWYCNEPSPGCKWFCWGNYFHCIEAVVTNQGNKPSAPTHVMIYIKLDVTPLNVTGFTGVQTFRLMMHIPGLVPQETYSVVGTLWHPGPRECTPPAGLPWHRITAVVDCFNRVPEIDEENNSYSFRLTANECSEDCCPWE